MLAVLKFESITELAWYWQAGAVLVYVGFVSVAAMFFIWWERKVSAHMQSRLGPMRTGLWHGWAQSPADGLKLLSKEDLIPTGADHPLFRLAPYLNFGPAFAALVVLPFSAPFVFVKLDTSVVFILAIISLEVIGVILAGWAANSKWSVYGAMREACQIVSYEIPLGLSVLAPCLTIGSLSLNDLAADQAGGIHQWLAFRDPFLFVGFFVFFIAALASCKRAPFDLPESESELVAGFHTEYSGMRFAFFFFSEYIVMFVIGAITVLLYLGGWYDPFGLLARLEQTHPFAAACLGAGNFILKSVALVFVQMWLRWTLPRLRIDQVLHMCVKVLLPVACVNLFGTALYVWLMPEGLPRLIVQTVLTAIGVVCFAAFAGMLFKAILRRDEGIRLTLTTAWWDQKPDSSGDSNVAGSPSETAP